MHFKRNGKTIFGVDLTAAEERALDLEIQKEIAEYDRKNEIAFDAVVLWHLYSHLGFEYDQLKDFYDTLAPSVDQMIRYYELGQADSAWICVQKLKDAGIDVERWRDESVKK